MIAVWCESASQLAFRAAPYPSWPWCPSSSTDPHLLQRPSVPSPVVSCAMSRSFLIRDLLWGRDRRDPPPQDSAELGLDLTTRSSEGAQVISTAVGHSGSLLASRPGVTSLAPPPSHTSTSPGADASDGREYHGCGVWSESGVGNMREAGEGGVLHSSNTQDLHSGRRRESSATSSLGGPPSRYEECVSWRTTASSSPSSPSPASPASPTTPPASPARQPGHIRNPSPSAAGVGRPPLLPGLPRPLLGAAGSGYLRPEKPLRYGEVRRFLPVQGGSRQMYGAVPLVPPQHHHYIWAAQYSSLLSSLPLQGTYSTSLHFTILPTISIHLTTSLGNNCIRLDS